MNNNQTTGVNTAGVQITGVYLYLLYSEILIRRYFR